MDRAPLPPRVDLYTAAVLLALGLGVMALAWRMPTFVEQSGTGLTAPGIVPGFHGTVIALLSVLLALRAIRRGALRGDVAHPPAWGKGDARQLGTAAGLGVLYAGFLVGTLPFWMATALFVFAFTAAFEWPEHGARRPRRLVEAALLGLAAGGAVTLVFERIFLVRLP
ncbi:tripartite tricarboxylate transporter TctB family protein [Falsiroseomonas selenitidurans]|uniref:Tripartite tricarboxylate transporter TctB family protein n=1 Tax=Falsiroseomonas selenitidurans TaxID=2716335 RepID=A0ABX1E6C0_9PROT|nr:tripartite tricarboxylate transporter TctB family protein [Falsiroseomonas selenitidurans]NKC32732.1 tripartite tricarboxylate transporter TctB family protein [Falsiroseomonas selenitidurans]